MKFLKHIRSRSRVLKDESPAAKVYGDFQTAATYHGPDRISRLPPNVLRRIFQEVCPQSCEDSYTSLEESTYEGCLLCDVRDLAACAAVDTKWYGPAQDMLYTHIQIEAVHYCEREIILADKRRQKSFLNRNADFDDPSKVRLQLLMRTVRENPRLAQLVESLRLPYMTREACKPELARTVSVLHSLRYVDLPEGFFNDDPSCNALKQELQMSCPEIRRMRYGSGSERSFVKLAHNRVWRSLEVLELAGIQLEPADLVMVLASFPALHELKFVDLPWLDDSVFRPNPALPALPPVQRLTFSSTPEVHAAGLAAYLSRPETREVLVELNMSKTGVLPHHLYLILSNSPYLESLSLTSEVSRSMPLDPPTPAMTSSSLKTLRYEISSDHSTRHNLHPPTGTYYTYLSSSLLSNSLPKLTDLYVLDPNFPEILLLTPPQRPFSTPSSIVPQSQHSSNGFSGLTTPLSIYTKSSNELEWNFTSISPPTQSSPGHRSATRPISLMGAESLSPAWGGSARRSVIAPNGLGGFLAVPSEEMPRRMSSESIGSSRGGQHGKSGDSGEWSAMLGAALPDRSKKERKDLWR